VHVRDTMGDCLYLYGTCQRVTVLRARFVGSSRTAIHAQAFRDVIIKDCQFRDQTDFSHIYQELDYDVGSGQWSNPGNRVVIVGCQFSASSSSFAAGGILGGGGNESSVSSGYAVVGNTFRGLSRAVVINRFSAGYAIFGNTIEDCAQGISGYAYSTLPGYAACEHLAVVGNVLRNTGSLGVPPVHIYNTTCSVIAANDVCAPASSGGIDVAHSKRVAINANAVTVGSVDSNGSALGIRTYRAQECAVTRNMIALPAGESSVGVFLDDDNTYPTSRILVAANQVTGSGGHAVYFYIFNSAGAQSAVVGNGVSSALSPAYGLWDTNEHYPWFDRQSIAGRKCTHGTAPPSTGSWVAGDKVINTSPSAGGYLGWVCVAAGAPGTWKGFELIAS
jgi:hypothetical protein